MKEQMKVQQQKTDRERKQMILNHKTSFANRKSWSCSTNNYRLKSSTFRIGPYR